MNFEEQRESYSKDKGKNWRNEIGMTSGVKRIVGAGNVRE